MIELNADGSFPVMTRCRVYIVAGYTDGRPFSGFNVWTDSGSMTPEDIEAYDTFKGWATEVLTAEDAHRGHGLPVHSGEFRVALMAHDDPRRGCYPALQRPGQRDLSNSTLFCGWLTSVRSVELPQPVPSLLMRFDAQLDGTRIEGLFITERAALAAALNAMVEHQGRRFALEPRFFAQLSDDQRLVEEMKRFVRDGSVSGTNPLLLPRV